MIMSAATPTSEATAGERLLGGQAITVVTSGASTTGTATCSGHCQARLEAGMTSNVLPSATSWAS
jgi:hypothetical protein